MCELKKRKKKLGRFIVRKVFKWFL